MSNAVRFVTNLAAGRKATQLYPQQHPAFVQAIDDLVDAANAATLGGVFTLNLHQGRLYEGSVVLPDDTPGVQTVEEAFEVRKIESLSLHPGFSRTDAVGLVEVLGIRPSPALDVEAELARRGVDAVKLAFLADESDEDRAERDRVREQDRALYRRVVTALRAMTAEISTGRATDLTKTSTMVAGIMGRLVDDPAAVLALATMRSRNEADLFHSVNVMIYALVLGAELGLPEQGLASLGTSALMHDIGKSAFEHGDPSQAEVMRAMHPRVGADILSDLSAEDPAPMLVAYEHHMNVNGGGFPDRDASYVAHPFSRMVAISDRYTNLTAPSDGSEALTPDRAILQVLREAGSALDPMFARLFAKAMGVFPVGCLVRISDQSVGVVARPGSSALCPVVRVAYGPDGLQLDESYEVDLGSDGRTIVEVVDPECMNTAVADHL